MESKIDMTSGIKENRKLWENKRFFIIWEWKIAVFVRHINLSVALHCHNLEWENDEDQKLREPKASLAPLGHVIM